LNAMRTTTRVLVGLAVAVGCFTGAASARAAERVAPLSLSALAVGPEDPSGPGRTQTGSVRIVIDRWSAAPATDNAEAVGFVRSGTRVVARIVSAHEETDRETDERRLVIVTDKALSQWAIHDQPRPLDASTATMPHESTTFEIRLSRFGTGEGRVTGSGSESGPAIRLAAVSVDREDEFSGH